MPNTQAEHAPVTQSAEAKQLQDTFLGCAEQPQDTSTAAAPRRGTDTEAAQRKRGAVPWQPDRPHGTRQERRETENRMLNIRSSTKTQQGPAH